MNFVTPTLPAAYAGTGAGSGETRRTRAAAREPPVPAPEQGDDGGRSEFLFGLDLILDGLERLLGDS